jgi:hypothetical protein
MKPIFKSPEELSEKLNEYFSQTPSDELTLTGLVLALGTNKTTLANYQKKPEFSHLINHAKLLIEHSYELSLKKYGRASDIFALKNFGWSDKYAVFNVNDDKDNKLDYIIQQLTGGDNE